MDSDSQQAHRQRRYRLHRSGIHDECLPERGCQKAPISIVVETAPLTPGDAWEAIEREFRRTVSRLDALNEAIAAQPLAVELLAEARGQARMLTSLATSLMRIRR